MTKPPSAQRFGKLTVLSTRSVKGKTRSRTKARCQCDCTRIVDVWLVHLRSGATQSCGKGQCRVKATDTKVRTLAPTGPRSLTLEQLQKAWACFHSVDTGKQRSMAQLAVRHRVPVRTLYDMFNTVRDVGGIDDYTALATKEAP